MELEYIKLEFRKIEYLGRELSLILVIYIKKIKNKNLSGTQVYKT